MSGLSPGRLPPARFSTLRSSEEPRRSCYGSCEAPRTLVARLVRSVLVQGEPPNRATPLRLGCLAAPLGRLGQDASHRHLQSTYDTSTRKSLDYRAHGFRRADPAVLPPAANSEPRPQARKRTFILRCAGPPCDNPTPVGPTLDGAGPASAGRHTVFHPAFSRRTRCRGALSGARPIGALSSPMTLCD